MQVKSIDSHSVAMEFSTDSIALVSVFTCIMSSITTYVCLSHALQVNSPSQWFLHVRFGLSMSSLFQDISLPFVLLSPPPPTTHPIFVFTEAFAPVPIYATIAVLTTVVLVLVVCMGVAVGVACMIQGRSKFNEKRAVLRTDQELSGKLNSACPPPPPVRPTSIKRTRSTIGFPTQEYRIKTTHIDRKRLEKLKSARLTNGLHRALSLPSILTSRAGGRSLWLPAPNGRRINPNRGHIRIKKHCSWTNKQQLKELENLHLVQVRHNHYGVNEIQQGSSQLRTGPYARFAVRNLAVSAKTPEPGSRPLSVL